MGRWVTSKGRRIYIPDEGEENPFAKKESTKEKASSSVDLSTEGTYKLNGQKAPKDLPEVSDEDAKHNKMVDYKGTKYSTQQVVDWDKEKGGEYVAGHMYIPHDAEGKGSFFVSKDREMYHSGSAYLNAQSKKKIKSLQDKEESTKQKQIASNKAQANERNIPARSQEEINSGKYNKYKQGMAYKNAKTVQVNGKTYKVWGDTTYRGTFAEDEHGNVLPIMGSGYLTKELSQRKAIANKFGEETFRKNKKKGK